MELDMKSRSQLRYLIEALLRMDVKQVLSYWINGEIEEAEMYYRLHSLSKEIMWDADISRIFFDLYSESSLHAEEILKTYKKLFPGESFPEVDLPSLKNVLLENKLDRCLNKCRTEELLNVLMESEKIASEVYGYLAEHASNPDIKKTFKWLSDAERGHYEKLESTLRKYRESR